MTRYIYYALLIFICLAYDSIVSFFRGLSKGPRQQNLKLISIKIRFPHKRISFSSESWGEMLSNLQRIEEDTGVIALESYKALRKFLVKENLQFNQMREALFGALFQILMLVSYALGLFILVSIIFKKPLTSSWYLSIPLTFIFLLIFLLIINIMKERLLKSTEQLLLCLVRLKLLAASHLSIKEVTEGSMINRIKSSHVNQDLVEQARKALKDWMEGGGNLEEELELIIEEAFFLYSNLLNKLMTRLELVKTLSLVFYCVPILGWNFQSLFEQSFGQH